MKLLSATFAPLLPIPGTARREQTLTAQDGWSLERLPDGGIRCERPEPVDGGVTVTRSFVVRNWPVVEEEVPVPVVAAEPEPLPATVRRGRKA